MIELLFTCGSAAVFIFASTSFEVMSIRSRAPEMTSPCILDTLPLIPFCDPPTLASQARHCTRRCGPSAWPMTAGTSALCVMELSKLLLESVHNFSKVSSSDWVLSSSGSSLCSVVRLASVSVGQTTLRSWSLGPARFSFTALVCFSSFLLHCQCALCALASPA